MGLALSCLPSLASCVVPCLGSLACSAVSKGNTDDYRVSKFLAVLLQAFSVALTLVLQSTDVVEWLGKVPGMRECGKDRGCYSLQIAYRIGFTTACVFAFHLVIGFFGRCFANKIQNSFWIFKFIFVVGGSSLLLLLPNSWFTLWGDVADVTLSLFLVIQLVWVLDFAYGWNDVWIGNAAEDESHGQSGRSWYGGLLICAAAFLGGAYTWYYFLFTGYGEDHSNRLILAINIGASTLLGLVSLFCARGGILPASLLILYIAWLSSSIVFSATGLATTDTRLGVGLALSFILIIYASYQVSLPQMAAEISPTVGNHDPVTASAEAPSQESMERGSSGHKDRENSKPEVGGYRIILFMNCMHLSGACYFMNLCLTWSQSTASQTTLIAYWVQTIAAWVALSLYSWVLVAPAVCQTRQF